MAATIKAISYERYNGGMHVKRLHGSSTVTRFFVYPASEAHNPAAWARVEGLGKTPGERKSYAIRAYQAGFRLGDSCHNETGCI